MRNTVNRYYIFSITFFTILLIASCSTVKYVTPQVVKTNLSLNNLHASNTKINVVDYRLGKHTDDVRTGIYTQLMQLLSQENSISGHTYTLTVDVIEYKSFFTYSKWHGEISLKVRLTMETGEILGSWDIAETTERFNMWGYNTAQEVSQEVYEKALSKLIASINQVQLTSE